MSEISDETKELLEQCIRKHGISIMSYFCLGVSKNGYEVGMDDSSRDSIWETVISIKKKDDSAKMKFYFYNTFMEIFCVDRDDDPPVVDPSFLNDESHIFDKITHVIDGRLILLTGLLSGKSVEDIYNENPGKFERIRMMEKKMENT